MLIQRIVVTVTLAALLVAGAWLLWQRPVAAPRPAPARTVTASPTGTATTVPLTAGEFRLAGTAVGEPTSWAAIERPDGVSHLYRNGDDVPDLGRILGIYPDHVVLDGPAGEVRLTLKPAATPTPERRRTSAVITPAREASSPIAGTPQR